MPLNLILVFLSVIRICLEPYLDFTTTKYLPFHILSWKMPNLARRARRGLNLLLLLLSDLARIVGSCESELVSLAWVVTWQQSIIAKQAMMETLMFFRIIIMG